MKTSPLWGNTHLITKVECVHRLMLLIRVQRLPDTSWKKKRRKWSAVETQEKSLHFQLHKRMLLQPIVGRAKKRMINNC